MRVKCHCVFPHVYIGKQNLKAFLFHAQNEIVFWLSEYIMNE